MRRQKSLLPPIFPGYTRRRISRSGAETPGHSPASGTRPFQETPPPPRFAIQAQDDPSRRNSEPRRLPISRVAPTPDLPAPVRRHTQPALRPSLDVEESAPEK